MKPSDIAFSEGALTGGNEGRVRVRWLGTAGFEIEHDGHVLLIDPYFTRASLRQCVFGEIASDRALIERHVRRADAIVCGHTHFDHVLDVPSIAQLTSARVFGSTSCVNLCRAAGVPQGQLVDVQTISSGTEARAEVGPFDLRFVPSAHSPLALGRVPLPGDISDCDQVPLTARQYRCGAVFSVLVSVAGRTLYHVGSANLDDSAWPSRREVDLMLMCAAGWITTERFVPRMLKAVTPGAIVLSHWDNLFRPLDRQPRPLPALKLPRLFDQLGAHARRVPVGTLGLLGDLWL